MIAADVVAPSLTGIFNQSLVILYQARPHLSSAENENQTLWTEVILGLISSITSRAIRGKS